MTTPYKTLGNDQVYVDRLSIPTRSYRDVNYTEDSGLEIKSTSDQRNMVKNAISNWSKIVRDCQGPPSVFLQALIAYGDVQCHDFESTCKFLWVLRKLSISEKHRIDTLPENVSLTDFLQDISQIQSPYSIVFNLRTQPRLLNGELFNLDNLRWLNMGSPHVTGLHFQKVVQAINLGKLKGLEGIVLTGSTVKKHDLIKDVISLRRGKLQYIETNHIIQSPEFTHLECEAGFRMMGDGAKFHHLATKKLITFHPGMILDYAVCKDWFERGGPPEITDFHCYKIAKVQQIIKTPTVKRSNFIAKVKNRKSTFFTLKSKKP